MTEEKPLTIAQQKKAWRDRNLEYARKRSRERYAKHANKIKAAYRVEQIRKLKEKIERLETAQLNNLRAKLSRLEAELEEWSKQ